MEQLLMDKWQNQVFMVVCKNCGYVGFPQRKKPGNSTIEFILWITTIVPGAIYSVWRSSSAHNACAVCQSKDVIFADSPIGRELVAKVQGIAQQGATITPSSDSSTQYILNQRAQLMQQKVEEQKQKIEDQKRRKTGDVKLLRWIIYLVIAVLILSFFMNSIKA